MKKQSVLFWYNGAGPLEILNKTKGIADVTYDDVGKYLVTLKPRYALRDLCGYRIQATVSEAGNAGSFCFSAYIGNVTLTTFIVCLRQLQDGGELDPADSQKVSVSIERAKRSEIV